MVMSGLGKPSVVFANDSGCNSTHSSTRTEGCNLPTSKKIKTYQGIRGHRWSTEPVAGDVANKIVGMDAKEAFVTYHGQLSSINPAAECLHRAA